MSFSIGSRVAWTLAACALAAACGKDAQPPEPTTFTSNAAELLDKVPGDAFVVAVLDARKPLWQFVTEGVLLPNKPDNKAALDKELKAFVDARFGVDVTKVSSAVVFASPRPGKPPAAGVLVQGVGGTLKGRESTTHNSVKLYQLTEQIVYAQVGPTLFLGDPDAVRASLDVVGGKTDSLDKKNPKLARLTKRHNGGAFLSVAAHLVDVNDREIQGMRNMSGIDHVAIRAGSSGISAMAIGDAEKMKTAIKLLRGRLEVELRNAADMKQRVTEKDASAMAGIMGIVQFHFLKNAISHLDPKLDGNQLTMSVPIKLGEQAGAIVALLGVGAATAIPAFMRYTKKAKNSEVEDNLRKLYTAARSYHLMHGFLPKSAGPTPALGSCCSSGGKCQPSLFAWRDETWRKLGFSVDKPHYYSYSLVRSYAGFTVRANGDLDCDGEYSTFEMRGSFTNGRAPTTVPIYREKELE